MNDYKVEKLAVDSTFLLIDGTKLTGSMYLAPQAPSHPGAQTVPDLMAEAKVAIPLHLKDGRFVLVGKDSVAAIKLEPDSSYGSELVRHIPVNVSLVGGHNIEGNLVVEQGGSSRLSDFLNLSEEWIRLHEPQCLVWFSKRRLAVLEPRIP